MSASNRRWVLGVDTGGTYTDAVLYNEHPNMLLAKAKAPTTHDDLAVGITEAIKSVLAAASIDPQEIRFVSLSTTLATNALVEGKGRPAALVMIGFETAVLDRGGLREALQGNSLVMVNGGHTSHGSEAEPLDREALAAAVAEVAPGVDGFAVTSQFSVRNPDHELAAREIIRELTGLPVTCSHELADALNGPKRSVTALLNARMIALINELVKTTADVLAKQWITAPIMVVRGNGSLVSADFVTERPVETILSGPAASLIGAAHLVGTQNALIADIGGTTTDIAVLRDGSFDFDAKGATVGGHQTMVEAVAMATHGLGGDSEVLLADRARGADLLVGPRRVVPLVVAVQHHQDPLLAALKRQLDAYTLPQAWSAVFVQPTTRAANAPVDPVEERLLAKITDPQPATDVAHGDASMSAGERRFVAADTVVNGSREALAMRRLAARGLVRLSAFTPTDAAHVLGTQTTHDPAVAHAAAKVWARRCDHRGKPIVATPQEFAELVVAKLVRLSAEHLLAMALVSDGLPARAASSEIVNAALDAQSHTAQMHATNPHTANSYSAKSHSAKSRTARLLAGLGVPLVGLGAPAATYYPAIGRLLDAEVVVPEHADVANAIGAAVGRVRLSRRVTVSSPRRGLFRVHGGREPEPFVDLEAAKEAAMASARSAIAEAMVAAGAPDYELETHWEEKSVDIGDRKLFVEGIAKATGIGPPQAH